MNKSTAILGAAIFAFSIVLLANSITLPVLGANNTQDSFNLSVVISNSPPSITGVANITGIPSEGVTTNVFVLFNVTDVNTYTDIDPTQSTANITRNGVTQQSSSCADYAAWTGGNIRGVTCTVAMDYYDEPGPWNISVRAQDSNPSYATNTNTSTMTYSTLYAFNLTKATVTFSSAGAGTNDVNASNDPQVLNNTGNGDFSFVNVTGYDLWDGVSDIIGPGNFSINATDDSATGVSIAGNVLIPSANLSRAGTQDLYVWVDIPSGIADGTYTTNSSTQWIVEAYN